MIKALDWAAAPKAMWDDAGKLTLAMEDGLAVLRDNQLDYLIQTKIDAATCGPHDAVYAAVSGRILRFDSDQSSKPADITSDFGGELSGESQLLRGSGGEIYVQGCRSYRKLDGTFAQLPTGPGDEVLQPLAADLCGNLWGLHPGSDATQVFVLPADVPDQWRQIPTESGSWEHLAIDHLGFVWIAGPAGCRRFSPRSPEAIWQTPAGATGDSPVTAMGISPEGLALVALRSGDVFEVDIDAAGETDTRLIGSVPSAVHLIYSDPRGLIWIAAEDGLYCETALADDRHQNWVLLPGRLPGGGNHDIFSVAVNERLYVAGGLSRFWGYPTTQHVFDELFDFDPASGFWDIVSYMPFPRRYCGLTQLDGRVWVIGGEGELGERGGDVTTLDVVDIYDPLSRRWIPGPRLSEPHTDPFVMTSGDRIWVVGGAGDDNRKLQTVESIGAGETSWRQEPDLPQPAREGGCCALDGVLYCGSDDGFFAFDTHAAQWDLQVPQPDKLVKAPLTTAFQGEVWMMGGARDDQTRCYDPRTRTWRIGPRLPTQQSWGGAAVLQEKLYITGGAHRCETHDVTIYDDRTWMLR